MIICEQCPKEVKIFFPKYVRSQTKGKKKEKKDDDFVEIMEKEEQTNQHIEKGKGTLDGYVTKGKRKSGTSKQLTMNEIMKK